MTQKKPNHSHAWKGSWNRPVFIDEDLQHPFTIARMTDHNVRGMDQDWPTGESDPPMDTPLETTEQDVARMENEGGLQTQNCCLS